MAEQTKRKIQIENLDFAKESHEDFSVAVGVKEETIKPLLKEAEVTFHSCVKFSDFAKKLDENYSKAEIILILIAQLK